MGGGYNSNLNKVTLSVDLDTGTLVNNTTGILSGNGLEAAIEYQRTLASVSWLSFYGKVSLKTFLEPNNYNLTNLKPNATVEEKTLYPEWYLNGIKSASFGLNYMEGGVRFGGWGYLAIRDGFRILAEAMYPVALPADNVIAPYAGINAYPYLRGSKWDPPPNEYGFEKVEAGALAASLQDLYAGLRWQITLIDRIGLGADFSWRTNGEPSVSSADVTGANSMWKIDSPASLKYNTAFRLNFTTSYRVTEYFLPYLQLRYEAKYVIAPPSPITNARRGRAMHDVKLRAGFTYQIGK